MRDVACYVSIFNNNIFQSNNKFFCLDSGERKVIRGASVINRPGRTESELREFCGQGYYDHTKPAV